MGHPSNGLTGAVVSVYIAGEALGALTQTFIGDRLGRIRFMQLECIIVTIGCTIQTASVNIGMFLAGRALAGYAVGYVSISPKRKFKETNRVVKWYGGYSPRLPLRNLLAKIPRSYRRYFWRRYRIRNHGIQLGRFRMLLRIQRHSSMAFTARYPTTLGHNHVYRLGHFYAQLASSAYPTGQD